MNDNEASILRALRGQISRHEVQKPQDRNKLGTSEKQKEGLCARIRMNSQISGGWQGLDQFTPREVGSSQSD